MKTDKLERLQAAGWKTGNAELGFGEGGVQPTPESASASLLFLGALGRLGRRPRKQ